MITAYERPGVYSDYTTNAVLYKSAQTNIIGIVAVTQSGEQNRVYEIKRVSDAQTIFGSSGLMCTLCETALSNGAYKIKAVSCGSSFSSQNYQSAFSVLATQSDVKIMICDTTDSTVLSALKQCVVQCSENKKERICILATTKANATTTASTLNCERSILVCQAPKNSSGTALSPCITASAIAGVIASNTNPTYSFNASKLYTISDLNENLTESEIEDFLEAGVTVLEKVNGNIEVIRMVTTKTTTSGQTDRTFHDINTVLIIDDVIPAIRNRLTPLIGNIRNTSLNSIKTQIALELETKKKNELISSYSQPIVSLSETDRSVCIAQVEFTVSKGINQIIVSAIINV